MNEIAATNRDGGVLAAILSDPDRLKSIPIETVERLYALHQQSQERAAQGALAAALADLQSRVPVIPKNRTAKIVSRKTGSAWSYDYADRAQIATVLRPHLADLRLSYTFDQEIDGNRLIATCTVRHSGGGTHTARFAAVIESGDRLSGTQWIEHAETTAQRRALASAFGLSTGDDAIPPDATPGDAPCITEQQHADLVALMTEVGADAARFLAWLGVPDLGSLPADRYQDAVRALETKRKAAS